MKVSTLVTVAVIMIGSRCAAQNRWIEHVGKLREELGQFDLIACIELGSGSAFPGVFDNSTPAQNFLRQRPAEYGLHVEKRQHAVEPAPNGGTIAGAMRAEQ